MPDMSCGLPPTDVQSSSIPRRPRVRAVVADNHPIELEAGDPALGDLLKAVGPNGMKEFGQSVGGGFRMIELLGLIDDPADQIPGYIVDDLKPVVPVLPLVSTRTKLLANALAAISLRGLGATIHGPFEEAIFLRPQDRTSLQGLAKTLLSNPGVEEVLEGSVWWAEVPYVELSIHDPDAVWGGYLPLPADVIEIFLW
ncbi:MAG: hypothetical protein VR70_07030 [Rhodospirillaceae bacterium BRH_c57]|nr:MAG: hypothetical protein VR70_07030 [Rhodospirillaceae bacterium BRH_c57]